jgi:integrase/recombinase XerD
MYKCYSVVRRMQVGNLLRSSHGSVRAYTRHEAACKHRKKKDHNDCDCAKWLYEHKRGQPPRRYTLSTPSWPEALEKATATLESFHPKIAAAQAAERKTQRQQKTIEEACEMWVDQGPQKGRRQYVAIQRKTVAWATREHMLFIQDVTTDALLKWSMSDDWKKHYADSTRRNRWSLLRGLFSFLHKMKIIDEDPCLPIKPVRVSSDLVQGPFTDDQVAAIFAHIADADNGNISESLRKVHIARLTAFVKLLLHSGCDLIDAVLFTQDKIEPLQIERRTVNVLRYRRAKTGVLAVVPLPDDVVAVLRSVPMLPENPAGMPFRNSDLETEPDTSTWSRRISRVLKAAGVEYVILEGRDSRGRVRKKNANAKMLRHTFAVRQLIAGQRPEAVAKMLGHKSVAMLEKHYAPWVKERDEAHVRQVMAQW